jgi:hypothetical protein
MWLQGFGAMCQHDDSVWVGLVEQDVHSVP